MSSPIELKQKERHHKEQMKSQQSSKKIAIFALGVAILSLVVSVVLHFF